MAMSMPTSFFMNASSMACMRHTTCAECVASSYGCHFCEHDFQCHAIGSIHGCTYGMTCEDIHACVRSTPESIGYGPTPTVVLSVFCLMLTLGLCCCAMSWMSRFLMCAKRRKSNNAPSRKRSSRVPDRASSCTNDDDDDDDDDDPEKALLRCSNEPMEMEDGETRFEQAVVDDLPFESTSERDSERTKVLTLSMMMWRALTLVSLIGLTIAALMYYPRIPDYNICNRKFDWSSIFSSLRSVSPKVQYEVLLSISNENRLSFELDYALAKINHNNVSVGSWRLEKPWIAQAGAISDLLLTIHIAPGFSEGMVLWKDFVRNTLVFDIDADVTGYIKYGNTKLYRLSTSVTGIEFQVDAVTPRNLCNCSAYDTSMNKLESKDPVNLKVGLDQSMTLF